MVKWTRRVRSVLASAADVTGDWFYYFYLRDIQSELKFDWYVTVFFGVCVASSFFSLLVILVVGLGCNNCVRCNRLCGWTSQSWVAFLELFLEDIPQLAASGFISYELGSLSPRAVFNITTSSVNLVLDLLDICEGWEEELSSTAKEQAIRDDDQDSLNGPYERNGAFPIPY